MKWVKIKLKRDRMSGFWRIITPDNYSIRIESDTIKAPTWTLWHNCKKVTVGTLRECKRQARILNAHKDR